MKKFFIISTLFFICFILIQDSYAKSLPRFVSLRADEVNMRTGPSVDYPRKFTYYLRNMPVEVLDEYQGWYKVRDYQGDYGWINKNLVSKRKTLIIVTEDIMFSKRNTSSRPLLRMEEKVVGNVKKCVESWCKVSVGKYTGWVEKKSAWGAILD